MHGAPIDHAMIGTPLINGKDVSKTYLLDRDMHKTPLKVTCASGLYLTLENGQKILDATGGAAVACLGHGNKEVQQAIHDQMEEVSYCHSLFFSTTSTDALARNLIEGTDHKMAKAFIVSSGSEAMEAAMKLSRQYFLELSIPEPSRINYIARDMSYHGSTLGALSMSGHLGRRAIYKPMLLSNIHRVSSCNPYRQKTHHDTMEAFVTRKVAELDAKFQELGPETVIAFVCEPIVGAALGCVPAAPGYLRAMKSICDKYGALFIMDEIMCGMGRSGTLHAWQQEDVVPDIQTIGKGLGGGYAPVAGILIGPRVVDTLAKGTGSFMHGQTYQAHPISCAAAFAVQNIIQKDDLLANVRFTGQRLEELLHQRLSNHPYVGDIRGRGLFWGIEFVNDKDTKEPFDPKLGISKRIHDTGMREPFSMSIYPGQGSADGIRGDHVILSPAYNVTLEEVNEIVSRFVAVVRKVFEDLDDTTLCGVFQAPKL